MKMISDIRRPSLYIDYIPANTGHANATFEHSTPSNQDKLNTLYKAVKYQEISKCVSVIKDMKNWSVNWDGRGAEKPNEKALDSAEYLLSTLFELNMFSTITWKSPNITADQDGTIVFEWWGSDDKAIVIYISPNLISYIKAKNENIEDMEEGRLDKIDLSVYQELFAWLK